MAVGKMSTPLARVLGLGSAKSGTEREVARDLDRVVGVASQPAADEALGRGGRRGGRRR